MYKICDRLEENLNIVPFLLFPRTNHSYLHIFLRRTRIYFYFKLISNKIFFNLLKASVQNFELRKIETFFIRGINVLTNVFLRILIVPKEKRKKSNKTCSSRKSTIEELRHYHYSKSFILKVIGPPNANAPESVAAVHCLKTRSAID